METEEESASEESEEAEESSEAPSESELKKMKKAELVEVAESIPDQGTKADIIRELLRRDVMRIGLVGNQMSENRLFLVLQLLPK